MNKDNSIDSVQGLEEHNQNDLTMDDDVAMESTEDIGARDVDMESVEDTYDDSTTTSIIVFNIYDPSLDLLKDPVLFQQDQLYNGLTSTDDSQEQKNKSIVYFSDQKFENKLETDRECLLSMDMKYRPGIVFSNVEPFNRYLPKYYVKEDSKEWSNAKNKASLHSLNFEYDSSSRTRIHTYEDIQKILNEIMDNPVWDSGLRIGNYDKLSQKCCFCPLSDEFDRCHKLFKTLTIIGKCNCNDMEKYPWVPSKLVEHCNFKTDISHQVVKQYLFKLYGNYWNDDVGHSSLHSDNSDDKKHVVAKYF